MLSYDASSAIVERAQGGQADAQIIHVNSDFEAITGYAREEAVGKICRYLQGSDRLQPGVGIMREALAGGTSVLSVSS